jgi:hypothetical protein
LDAAEYYFVRSEKGEMLRRFRLSRTIHALLTAATVVLFIAPAMGQQTAATLLVQVGQVSLLKDGNPLALSVGQAIRADQVVVTGDNSYAKFQVADGSIFEVFEKSQVTFRDKGGSWKDLLNVWIGHVKVYIQHLYGPNPTSVTSPTAVISVRGTIFDVVVEDEDGTTLVSVDEGLVMVRNTTAPGHEPLLKQGESVRVFRNQPLLGSLVNRGGGVQKALQVIEKAVYDYLLHRPGGVGGAGPVGGAPGTTAGGAQGDKSKTGTGAGTPSGTTTAPPPPAAPAPPPPPGSGGH